MGDFLNPVYDVVTPTTTTTTNNSESDTKCGGKKSAPTPAPRPSILRKKSLPSPGKVTIESQVPPIVEVPSEENCDSLGSGSNQTQNDEPFYEEPVKHFPPPSYPPPKPPRKSSDNP